MPVKTLFIQNMVCPRCIRVVREDLEKLGAEVKHVELGKAEIDTRGLSTEKIREVLEASGFELLQDKESRIIEKAKLKLLKLLDREDQLHTMKMSEYLARELGMSYSQLSKLFSRHEGLTLEKFFIGLKIQKVKELLKYDQLSLEQIAFRLHYSSAAHLSRQFKANTGLTASEFRKKFLNR